MLVGLRKQLRAPFWGPGHSDQLSGGGIEASACRQASVVPLVVCYKPTL